MKTEELQQAFAELAERVVPVDDPYGRLVRRARRRRTGRLVSAAASVLALAWVGIASTLVGPGLGRGPGGLGDPGRDHPGFVVASNWAWQLVNSPTRGNLAQDTAFFEKVFEHLNRIPSSALPQTKMLFADETDGVQRAVVVRYSETNALVESIATSDDFSHTQGSNLIPLEPVIVTDFGADPSLYPGEAAIALAPPGCAIATSAPISRPGAQRTWSAPVGDRLYFPNTQAPVIRVTCDGVVRQQGPVGLVVDALARSISREDFAGQAAAAYQQLTNAMGLSGAGQMRWSGPLALGGTSEVDNKETRTVYVVGPAGSAAGPLVCYVAGSDPYAFIAQEFIENPAPAIPYVKPFTGSQFSRISTGVAGDSAIALIRIPGQAGDRVGLTEQLLVLVPAGATRIEASEDGAVVGRADVTDGAALVNVRMGSPAVIQAFGPDDAPLASTQLVELTSGNRLFNEPLTADW